jgi:predicted ribosomally synthesized peptide with SipW-like signal peptide
VGPSTQVIEGVDRTAHAVRIPSEHIWSIRIIENSMKLTDGACTQHERWMSPRWGQTPAPQQGAPVHRTTNKSISFVAALVSLAVVGLLITRASNAAFTASTESTGNSFSAGEIDLTDDDAGSAMFTSAGLVPGSSVTECITVTYQGTIADPSPVRLYSGGLTDGGLAPHLDVVVQEGTGGSASSCAGFTSSGTVFTGTLASFAGTHTGFADGAGTWDPSASPQSRTYQVQVTLGADTPNSAQGDDAEAAFTWEVQS